MPQRQILFGIGFFVFLLLLQGCQYAHPPAKEKQVALPEINRVVVIGFLPAISTSQEPGPARSPLTGSVFLAEPVPRETAQELTAKLFQRLLEDSPYDLISPGQARGVFSSLISENMSLGDTQIYRQIGQAFDADAVLIGYVYRWHERKGGEYAVERPASVAFDLHLLRPQDGAILRRSKFDKTQRSLSENLLELGTFLKGKGRWMSVEELGELGFQELLKILPLQEPSGEVPR